MKVYVLTKENSVRMVGDHRVCLPYPKITKSDLTEKEVTLMLDHFESNVIGIYNTRSEAQAARDVASRVMRMA